MNHGQTEEEKKAILFVRRLVLADYYANCMKPALKNANERTPFIEYLVPVFKYFSAVYKK